MGRRSAADPHPYPEPYPYPYPYPYTPNQVAWAIEAQATLHKKMKNHRLAQECS